MLIFNCYLKIVIYFQRLFTFDVENLFFYPSDSFESLSVVWMIKKVVQFFYRIPFPKFPTASVLRGKEFLPDLVLLLA